MNTTSRRILSTSLATGVLCLVSAAPAAAEYEPGSGPQSVTREGYVSDESIESLRTGMGVLMGMVVAGTVVVAVRRRTDHIPPEPKRVSGNRGGSPDQVGDLQATPRAGLA